MKLHRLFMKWSRRMRGKFIRGQFVVDCEMTLDTLGPPSPRVFLRVLFRENPPTQESEELNLLQRVFSEIPSHAYTTALTLKQARRIMAGEEWVRWLLADELPGEE